MELKTILLQLNIVEDNEYLDKYCELIETNKVTKRVKGKTHKHHIIPKSYYKINGISVDNSPNNLVNLLFKEHMRNWQYLYEKYPELYA